MTIPSCHVTPFIVVSFPEYLPVRGGNCRETVQYRTQPQAQRHPRRKDHLRPDIKEMVSQIRALLSGLIYRTNSRRPLQTRLKRSSVRSGYVDSVKLTMIDTGRQDPLCSSGRRDKGVHYPSSQTCAWTVVQEEGSPCHQGRRRVRHKIHGHNRRPDRPQTQPDTLVAWHQERTA